MAIYFKKSHIHCIMIYKMKKLIYTLLLFVLSPFLCFGQNNFQFSLAPRYSLTYGELTELLYGYDEELVSQLDWEQKPLLNIGLKTSVNYKGFIISADFDYGIHLPLSYMYDSDWEDGEKYSFTKHPITNSVNIDTSLTAAYQIDATSKISVIPELQLNYLYSYFEAGNGSGVRRGRDIRVYGIDYKRHSFFLFTGIGVKFKPIAAFNISADFMAAPWHYQDSYDYHHGVKHPFSTNDLQYGFFTKYKAGITADFALDNLLALELFTNLLFGFPDKGTFYSDYYSDKMTLIKSQQSGADIYYIKTGLALKFTF